MHLTDLHKRLLNDFQRDFPLSPTPFKDIANRLGVSEQAILVALGELSQQRIVSRVGPVFAPNRVGTSTLAALAVPEEQLETVAEWINTLPAVNHNYQREHRYNLWFVLTASSPTALEQVLEHIEQHLALPVLSLPLLEEFHIDLGFPLHFDEA